MPWRFIEYCSMVLDVIPQYLAQSLKIETVNHKIHFPQPLTVRPLYLMSETIQDTCPHVFQLSIIFQVELQWQVGVVPRKCSFCDSIPGNQRFIIAGDVSTWSLNPSNSLQMMSGQQLWCTAPLLYLHYNVSRYNIINSIFNSLKWQLFYGKIICNNLCSQEKFLTTIKILVCIWPRTFKVLFLGFSKLISWLCQYFHHFNM